MNLIDLAFINKFSNGNNNSLNNNEIGELRSEPAVIGELPEIGQIPETSERFYIQEIKINNLSLIRSYGEYPLNINPNLIASGTYIISCPIQIQYFDKITPYIIEVEKVPTKAANYNMVYKKITEWNEKIDILNKTENYFQIGFIIPELDTENEFLVFYGEYDENDSDYFWYYGEIIDNSDLPEIDNPDTPTR